MKRLVTGESITHDTAVQTLRRRGRSVADMLAFRNVDGGLGGGTVTSVAPSAKRLSVSSGRRKRRNDQPKWTATVRFENPDGSLVMQESCQGTHRECWI